MNASIRFCTLVLLMIFCAQLPAFGDWPCRTDISVPVAPSDGNQSNVRLCSDGKNGAIMVWQDRRGGLIDKLFLQRVGASGNPIWQSGGVALSASAGYQYYAQIVADGQGGAVVVWEDNRSGVDYDIYAQRISAAGIIQWNPGGVVVCNASGHQYNPQVIADGSGGFIITWQDARSGQFDIYAERLTGGGHAMWQLNSGRLICAASGDQTDPRLAPDGAGGAVIAWTDYRGGTPDIYAQRILSTGQVSWTTDGVAACGAQNIQWNPQVVSDGAGGAIICWQDRRSGLYDNIYTQRIDAAGVRRWVQDGVQVGPSSGPQYYPRMVADGSGGAVIAWQDNRTGVDYDIYAQRITGAGNRLWSSSGLAVCTALGHQYNPQVIKGSSSVMLTWQDRRNGADFDVYAQRLDLNGTQQWLLNGNAVSASSSDQFGPQITSDSLDGGIVAWGDYRGSTGFANIFSQRVGANGRPAGGCYQTFIQDSLALKATRWSRRGGLPKPNAGNVRDAVFARGMFPDGIVIGIMRLDSMGRYGWEYYRNTYFVRRTFPQVGIPRPFAFFFGRYFVGRLSGPTPRMYSNALAAELLALKLNIAASDAGITESQLGDLVYRDTTGLYNPLDRKSLRQITSAVDSMLTFWRKYTAIGINYLQLHATLKSINTAFDVPIDTISTSPLKLRASRTLFSAPWLIPNVAPPTVVLPPLQPQQVVEEEVPGSFELSQNYPNPFNPFTLISFNLPERSNVTLKVYDVLGREVATLINREEIEEGPQMVEFDAMSLASGVYFYQLQAEPLNHQHRLLSNTKKMLLLK